MLIKASHSLSEPTIFRQHYVVTKVHKDVVIAQVINSEETEREWCVEKRLLRGQGYPTISSTFGSLPRASQSRTVSGTD